MLSVWGRILRKILVNISSAILHSTETKNKLKNYVKTLEYKNIFCFESQHIKNIHRKREMCEDDTLEVISQLYLYTWCKVSYLRLSKSFKLKMKISEIVLANSLNFYVPVQFLLKLAEKNSRNSQTGWSFVLKTPKKPRKPRDAWWKVFHVLSFSILKCTQHEHTTTDGNHETPRKSFVILIEFSFMSIKLEILKNSKKKMPYWYCSWIPLCFFAENIVVVSLFLLTMLQMLKWNYNCSKFSVF